MTSNLPFHNVFLCEYWSPLLLLNLGSSLQSGLWGGVKYSFDSSSSSASTTNFILSSTWFLILQILAFNDMFHSLLFNFYVDIQTWKLILLELRLKYRSSYKDNISIHCVILHCLIHIVKVFYVLLFHPSYLISSDLLFWNSHNITTMSLPTISTFFLLSLWNVSSIFNGVLPTFQRFMLPQNPY